MAEFRILARKTVQLFVTIIFCDSTDLATVTQLGVLCAALVMHCKDPPFAETGSKAAEFGNSDGFSRADKLEALSLVSQMGLVFLAWLASDDDTRTTNLIISILALVCVALPAVYGACILLTEWKSGRQV